MIPGALPADEAQSVDISKIVKGCSLIRCSHRLLETIAYLDFRVSLGFVHPSGPEEQSLQIFSISIMLFFGFKLDETSLRPQFLSILVLEDWTVVLGHDLFYLA